MPMDKELEEYLNAKFKTIAKNFEDVNSNFESMHLALNVFKKDLAETNKKIEAEKTARLFLTKELREKNVVIHGITEPADDPEILEDQVITFLSDNIQVAIGKREIDRVIKLGAKGVTECPVKVQLCSMKIKDRIVKARPKLKGTGKSCNDDLPKELRLTRKKRPRSNLSLNSSQETDMLTDEQAHKKDRPN